MQRLYGSKSKKPENCRFDIYIGQDVTGTFESSGFGGGVWVYGFYQNAIPQELRMCNSIKRLDNPKIGTTSLNE